LHSGKDIQAQFASNVEDLSGRSGFHEQLLGDRVGIPTLVDVASVLLPRTTIPSSCGQTNAWQPSLRSEWTHQAARESPHSEGRILALQFG
jgi:hypothetical protein